MPLPKPQSLPVALCFGLSVILLATGLFAFYDSQTFVAKASRVQGTVVELVERSGSKGTTYSPVFTFSDASGKTHRIYSGLSSYPASHEVGDQVVVLYDPANPAHARLDTFSQKYFWAFLAVAGSASCFFSGVILLVVFRFFAMPSRRLGG
jgi:hypothetical protein